MQAAASYDIYGALSNTSNTGYGGYFSNADASHASYGVYATSASSSGYGLYAANSSTGYAGYFSGKVNVTGACSGCTGAESTVATGQTVAASNCGTTYVATAALTLTFNRTTTLTTNCVIYVEALGGAVTLTPTSADQFNGQVAATSVVLPQGADSKIVTDANGHLYATTGNPSRSAPSTNNTDGNRWFNSSTVACNNTEQLICYVNP
jgi:hypothetical protein